MFDKLSMDARVYIVEAINTQANVDFKDQYLDDEDFEKLKASANEVLAALEAEPISLVRGEELELN